MKKTKLVTIEKKRDDPATSNRFISVMRTSLKYGILTLLIIDGLLTGVWTMLPTALLPWGASKSNLIGYISHCSFAPVSTLLLLGVSVAGILLLIRIKKLNPIGYTVMAIGILGMVFGIIKGISIQTFMLSSIGIGVGIVAGMIIGLLKKEGAEQNDGI